MDFLFVFRSNIIFGFFRHHGGIFVIRCCSIFFGLIFEDSRRGETRSPKGLIA